MQTGGQSKAVFSYASVDGAAQGFLVDGCILLEMQCLQTQQIPVYPLFVATRVYQNRAPPKFEST